jgi:low affinity Fe/Cu permease
MAGGFARIACRTADWFATPAALLSVPIGCGAWILLGLPIDTLTLLLSILAISMTQLVLVSQGNDERAVQHKLDELIVATPEADNGVAGEERQP